LEKRCPVCGMMVGDKWKTEYKAKTYYFMSAKHKEMFEANPERYIEKNEVNPRVISVKPL
jgi:YHS domain-containing protein